MSHPRSGAANDETPVRIDNDSTEGRVKSVKEKGVGKRERQSKSGIPNLSYSTANLIILYIFTDTKVYIILSISTLDLITLQIQYDV